MNRLQLILLIFLLGTTSLFGVWTELQKVMADNGTASGSAILFQKSGAAWGAISFFLASDGAANDRFYAPAFSGNFALVGAYGDDSNQGSAFFFYDEENLIVNNTYYYWLASVTFSGETDIFSPVSLTIPEPGNNPDAPEIISNITNYPNPFSNSTTISFETTNSHEQARIDIYNLKGQKMRTSECINCVDAEATQSLHSIIRNGNDFNGNEVSSGICSMTL